MSVNWPVARLGDLAAFRNGVNYTQAARHRGGLPIIGVKDFQTRLFVDFNGLEELDPHEVDIEDSTVAVGDILFVRSNGNRDLIGRSMLVSTNPPRPTTHSGFTIRLRFKDDRAVPRFFAYVLRGSLIRRTLSSQGGGTNINNLNQGILASLQVPFPPKEVQQRIASVLGAYDDLIDINRRRIELLNEIVRRIFEETYQPSDSAGWPRRSLRQVIDFEKGRKPTNVFSEPMPNTVPQLLLDVLRGASPKYVASDRMVLARTDDTLMVMDGSGSSEVFIGHEGAIGSTLGRFRCGQDAGLSPYWLYLFLSQREAELRSNNTGAAVPHANKEYIFRMEFGVPPAEVSEHFDRAVRPAFELVMALTRANRTLSASRDFLLPRLTSDPEFFAPSVSCAKDAA